MTHAPSTPRAHARERGQVVVIFAGGILVFVLLLAVVLDVSWYWANTLKVQRAADAAALAGAVYLPANTTTAYARARAEAQKNGYIDGTSGTMVTPTQDSNNPRQLNVTVSAPVGTFFMRVIGISQITASRGSKAEFVLPVPMGSPENYYGVFGTLRGDTYTAPVTQTTTTTASGNTDWLPAGAATSGGQWGTPGNAAGTSASANDNAYATEDTTSHAQQWDTFRFLNTTNPPVNPRPRIPTLAANQTIAFDGIEVRLTDVGLNSTTPAPTNCRLNVELWSSTAGAFSTMIQSAPITNTNTNPGTDLSVGSATDISVWGSHTWDRLEFDNFRVRLTWVDNVANCPASRSVKLDLLEARVSYTVSTTTTTTSTQTVTTNDPLEGPGTACVNGASGCFNPDGATLNPRGFWATMNTRGASNVNGDAHQPYYDTVGSNPVVAPVCPAGDSRSCYDPAQYYNYAVEMPAGSTGGYVYVFDPGFCATATNKGTGDRWFGSSNGVSFWYELWQDDDNTPYNLGDDTRIAWSDSLFENMDFADSTMGGSGGAECLQKPAAYGDARDYHNSWYLLNPGNPLDGGPAGGVGMVYRIHTTGTDPDGALLSTTDGEQSFALYAEAAGGTPRIYGMGAMQMFTPLSSTGGSTSSVFYLAQIDGVHEGKSVEIQLWDPGDTSPLTANLEILVPNFGGWSPTLLDYTAQRGTSNSAANIACDTNAHDDWPNIVTEATGSQPGEFNGCWLTISVTVPTGYGSACRDAFNNPVACQDGWWKIRYNMTGTGTSNDVTTWKVTIRGNPVHLKVP